MDEIKLNLPPFYKGQKVVSLVTHPNPTGAKKGNTYTVYECFKCSCGHWMVQIVEFTDDIHAPFSCNKCYKDVIKDTIIGGSQASDYAPIETRFISFAEVIEIESPLTGAN